MPRPQFTVKEPTDTGRSWTLDPLLPESDQLGMALLTNEPTTNYHMPGEWTNSVREGGAESSNDFPDPQASPGPKLRHEAPLRSTSAFQQPRLKQFGDTHISGSGSVQLGDIYGSTSSQTTYYGRSHSVPGVGYAMHEEMDEYHREVHRPPTVPESVLGGEQCPEPSVDHTSFQTDGLPSTIYPSDLSTKTEVAPSDSKIGVTLLDGGLDDQKVTIAMLDTGSEGQQANLISRSYLFHSLGNPPFDERIDLHQSLGGEFESCGVIKLKIWPRSPSGQASRPIVQKFYVLDDMSDDSEGAEFGDVLLGLGYYNRVYGRSYNWSKVQKSSRTTGMSVTVSRATVH